MKLGVVFLAVVVACQAIPARAGAPDVWAITGARIVPVSGPPIEKGTVVIRDGLIESVGPAVAAPADARTIDGTGLTVYPGLIDSFTFVEADQQAQGPGPEGGRRGGGPPQGGARAPDRDNPSGVTPEREALPLVKPDGRIESFRNAGITTVLAVPKGGIFRGQSALVDTAGASAQAMSVKTPVAQHVSFETGGGFNDYPGSLMGVIAVIRQKFLDGQHYKQEWQRYSATPKGYRRPAPSESLAAVVPALDRTVPVVIEANDDAMIRRALKIVSEFKLKAMIAGGLEAWKAADALKTAGVPVLLSLNYPERPGDMDPETTEPLRVVQARMDAPGGAAKLQKAGVRFAFQVGGLKDPKQFVGNAIKAVGSGLSKDDALRAMTLTSAELLGVSDQLGSIEAGKIANLVVTDGDLFEAKTKIKYVFVDGARFEMKVEAAPKPGEAAKVDVSGTWNLTVVTPGGNQDVTLTLTQSGTSFTGSMANAMFGTTDVKEGTVSGNKVSFSATVSVGGTSIDTTFNGTVEGDSMSGTVAVSGQGTVEFTGKRPRGAVR
ncbi:MAG TPA: amidohydrolase family protein [Blastocatellia bacterium]|nr:amidohydrolase family protein [Blastocatellia bacterium]